VHEFRNVRSILIETLSANLAVSWWTRCCGNCGIRAAVREESIGNYQFYCNVGFHTSVYSLEFVFVLVKSGQTAVGLSCACGYHKIQGFALHLQGYQGCHYE
jgi:hypothetical protein